MINLLLLLLFLTCIGITAAWIAENPGHVTMHWFDYRIDTSFAFLLFMALLSAVVLAYLYLIIRRIILAPEYHNRQRELKKHRKGLAELTHSVAALAAADSKAAETHTRKAEKWLGRTPLTLLLSAQIARIQGDDIKTRALLIQMLEHKETEYLAARSLSESASKQQLFPQALELAQRAHALNPQGIVPLLSLHIRLGEWQQAMQAIDKAVRKGQITRNEMRHYKGLVYLQQGMKLLAEGQHEAALAAAQHCIKMLPAFAPAVLFCANTFTTCKQPAKALKIITAAWKKQPQAQLGEAFRHAIAGEPKEKQLKLVQKLAASHPESIESDLVVAQIAIQQREWEIARKTLKAAMNKAETVRVCKLMADVEKGQSLDFDAGNKWLARSASAIADPAWICRSCGHATPQWSVHCPSCNEFDSLEWKQRDMTFVN